MVIARRLARNVSKKKRVSFCLSEVKVQSVKVHNERRIIPFLSYNQSNILSVRRQSDRSESSVVRLRRPSSDDPESCIDPIYGPHGACPQAPPGRAAVALTYGGERERGPVEAVDVLPGQRRVAGALQVVHPVVGAEADDVADREVQARVPVDQYEYGEHHLADAEHVRVTGLGFGPVEELQHAGRAEQPVGPHQHRAR